MAWRAGAGEADGDGQVQPSAGSGHQLHAGAERERHLPVPAAARVQPQGAHAGRQVQADRKLLAQRHPLSQEHQVSGLFSCVPPPPPPNHPHPHHLTPLCFLYTLATIHRKSETFLISVTHSLKNIKSVGRLVVSPHPPTTPPHSASCILWLQFIESPRPS